MGQQVQGQEQVVARVAHPRGQRPEHPFLLPFLGQAGFAPAVARFYGRQGLDEDGGAAVGNVVDDARGLGLVLGLNQKDETAVALGDDGFLHHRAALVPAQAALHYLVELLVGGTGLAAQLPQVGAGVVKNLAGGADGPGYGLLQVAQAGDVGGNASQQGQVVTTVKGLPVESGGAGQLTNLVQFLAPQDAAQDGPLDIFAQVGAGAELQAAAVVQEETGLAGFLETGSDFPGVAHRLQGQGAVLSQPGAGKAGQPLPYQAELQQVQGLFKAAEAAGSVRAVQGIFAVLQAFHFQSLLYHQGGSAG